MNAIVNGRNIALMIMAGISAATLEQTHGIEQANPAIMDMDGVTQQNAALVEEAAAAQAMQQQASELAKLVSVFEVGAAVPAVAAPTKLLRV